MFWPRPAIARHVPALAPSPRWLYVESWEGTPCLICGPLPAGSGSGDDVRTRSGTSSRAGLSGLVWADSVDRDQAQPEFHTRDVGDRPAPAAADISASAALVLTRRVLAGRQRTVAALVRLERNPRKSAEPRRQIPPLWCRRAAEDRRRRVSWRQMPSFPCDSRHWTPPLRSLRPPGGAGARRACPRTRGSGAGRHRARAR
jgi:hypothetical protein